MLGGSNRPASPPRPTPTPTIQHMIDDWSEGGVQMYDIPMDTTDGCVVMS